MEINIKEFKELKISKEFLKNIKSLGYENMTEIQSLAIPEIFKNNDLIAQAKTGSGKTVAFSLPLVDFLNVKDYKIQSLVLAPTRELANQIANEIRKLARHIHNVKVLTLCGGVPYKPQVASLRHGAHIIVGTPGRILQHIFETKVDLSSVKNLVLDEADRMLDMGFNDDILKIIDNLPKNRQTLFFSATFEENIKDLTNTILKEPKFVKSEIVHEEKVISQIFYELEEESKSSLIPAIISSNKALSTLIFCNTKIECEELANKIDALGIDVLTLHSDLDQRDRDETITIFSNKSYPVLICTDVASRGLDIDDVDLVINYDIARDEMIHTHRIGRTGRAGKKGISVTFYSKDELFRVEPIKEKFYDISFANISDINDNLNFEIDAPYRTILILGGKKQKVRAGDILGALTAGIGLDKNDIGKINILDFVSYVAVKKEYLKKALNGLERAKIKGKRFRVFEK